MPISGINCTYLLELLRRDGVQGALQLVAQPLASIGHRLRRAVLTACGRDRTSAVLLAKRVLAFQAGQACSMQAAA